MEDTLHGDVTACVNLRGSRSIDQACARQDNCALKTHSEVRSIGELICRDIYIA
ncbi:hypothetical protein [Paraburkholderia phytofirmans]|uniref:hypothetical protein n=1 Tax=Paraburkholderia phytofirmans TaxID=261302 RepID=UPI001314F93A|nr:hypothetical protein [Paraburkholderia phytofirmans]